MTLATEPGDPDPASTTMAVEVMAGPQWWVGEYRVSRSMFIRGTVVIGGATVALVLLFATIESIPVDDRGARLQPAGWANLDGVPSD